MILSNIWIITIQIVNYIKRGNINIINTIYVNIYEVFLRETNATVYFI